LKVFFLWCNLVYMMKSHPKHYTFYRFVWISCMISELEKSKIILLTSFSYCYLMLSTLLCDQVCRKIFSIIFTLHCWTWNTFLFILSCVMKSHISWKMDVEQHTSEMILYIQYLKILDKDIMMKPLVWLFKF